MPVPPGKNRRSPKISNQQSAINVSAPIAWTIAGSDSGGGAGIQADLKTMNAFGVHGCSVITALTAQNTMGVQYTESVSETLLRTQLDALIEDLPPVTIKTGMLDSTANCEILADFISRLPAPRPLLICDPVLQSTSGTALLNSDAIETLKSGIFPFTTVLTPNLHEAKILLGAQLPVEDAAVGLLELGSRSVLIKGGHSEGNECLDYWTDGMDSMWLSSPRINTRDTHGTGCILSSAIASAIALGHSIPKAVITAKTFLNQCLKSSSGIGTGHGPMRIALFRNKEEDRPAVAGGMHDCGHSL